MIQKVENMVRETAEENPLHKLVGIVYVGLKNSFNKVKSDNTYSKFSFVDCNIIVEIRSLDLHNQNAIILISGKEEKLIKIQKGGTNVQPKNQT